MKNIFYFFVFLFSMGLAAQSRNIQLSWQEPKAYAYGLEQKVIPFFDSQNYNFNPVSNTLLYRESVNISAAVNPASLVITNVVYESISVSDLKDLPLADLPTQINAQIHNVFARDAVKLSFSFAPIIREGQGAKRVKSIQYSYREGGFAMAQRNTADAFRSNSVLQSGNWFQFYIEKSGVYKISKSFLSRLGVPEGIDPRTIRLYGNGGRMLPLLNEVPYPNDLTENAIQVIGEGDGVFNDSDFILFYGEGMDQWSEENLTHLNLYDNKAYYFLTYGAEAGKRISGLYQPSGGSNSTYTSYDGYVFHERDLTNIGRLGRKWFGENFGVQQQQNFTFDLFNIDASQPVKVNINAASASFGGTSFAYTLNNQNLGSVTFNRISGQTVAGYENYLSKSVQINNASATVTVTYNNGGVPSSEGYLDFIALEYTANLTGSNKQFLFSNKSLAMESGNVTYMMNNTGMVDQIWDVTDINNVQTLINNGQGSLSFKAPGGSVRKYTTVSNSDFYEPILLANSKVANQNLKGAVFNEGDVDYLIITDNVLKAAAERLASFHRSTNGLKVKVVTVDQIYKEFSSGKQDVAAIRNFVKYVYKNASSPAARLKYVNMFGDASFDYKDRIPNNRNIVPVFYGMNLGFRNTSSGDGSNFSAYTTFMSDDFYVLMDDGEGLMLDADYGLDLAVGRMLAKSLDEANAMVDKVVDYSDKESHGRWRNVLVALSDDVDVLGDFILQKGLDEMIDKVSLRKPFFNVKKIHMDSYLQESAAAGKRYPQAKKDFIESIENGALFINYFGHGGEEGLAQERIFGIDDAQKLNNYKKYPLFVTITCEFTRFDNPYRLTGGESMYKNRRGGAIALIATTREIGIESGRQINASLSEYLFPDSNQYSTIAEALMNTKNNSSQRDKNVVFYIGDPALKLAIARPKVVLTKINDQAFSEFTGNLEALGYVKLGGELRDENDQFLNQFNGGLAVQIFDKEIDRKTLGNDQVMNNGVLAIMDFKTLGETIFRGNATVKQGMFNFDFVLPKDIKIAIGPGKVSFYATQDTGLDFTGSENKINVGGINLNAPEDKIAPTIKLFMNDESFISGGVTSESPVFLVFLEDENGINTSSGIGHDLTGILDGDEANPIVMNDYYETEPDNFRKGKVRYPFKDLSNGLHTLSFKAWDVYNNLATAEIQFLVSKEEGVSLEKVLNYPNPFVNYTEFWFTHNRPFENLEVQVQIMTVTGRIVKTINQLITTNGNLSRDIKWDGLDDFGDRIGKGVYIYRLTVKSTVTNHKSEKIEKLVIL
ncbi:type IX secretion system sortase PorU [Flavobacterium sp. JP2137]|uniref:type IX secretion system sortase PorU n=1 Tax=Flavobacterium sp. JP2137 TaxID=3414510 RepID=UPI003D2FF6C9